MQISDVVGAIIVLGLFIPIVSVMVYFVLTLIDNQSSFAHNSICINDVSPQPVNRPVKKLSATNKSNNKKISSDPILEEILLVPDSAKPTTKQPPKPINTSSNIKEFRLPDGSRIAFDITKVEYSEKSVIE